MMTKETMTTEELLRTGALAALIGLFLGLFWAVITGVG